MKEFFRFAPGLRNITEMYVDENRIRDIRFIRDFLKLQIFHASKIIFNLDHNWITDMSPLGNLQSLTEIMLSSNKIHEIQGLHNKSKLNILLLSNNSINYIDNLENLENLK